MNSEVKCLEKYPDDAIGVPWRNSDDVTMGPKLENPLAST